MLKLLLCVGLLALVSGVPQKFSKFKGGKIVGGEDAKITDFPYQVSFRFYDTHMCGGSILDEYTIVTAAHCTDGLRPTRMSVMVGSEDVEGGAVHEVDYFLQHPMYDEDTTDYDVSVLKLKTPLELSDKVQPIALQESNDEVEPGTVATISGWGGLFEGDEETPRLLQKVDVDVITEKECKEAYRFSTITARMLCAKRLGKDSCQGDSGGPLMANGKLIGIVSWGIGCARPSYPGVYTKVSNLHHWIEAYKHK